jgi:5'-3' exonuclease
MVPSYKLHRKVKRNKDTEYDWDDFYAQLALTEKLFKEMGVVVTRRKYLEADDIIGACTRCLEYENMMIVSTDADMHQLVDTRAEGAVHNVVVWNPVKDIVYREEEVMKEYGILPKQIPLWKALAGDSSDGIPGVTGIGPKTATQIIQTSGADHHWELLNDNRLEKLKPRSRKLLEESAEGYSLRGAELAILLTYDMYGANHVLAMSVLDWQPYNPKTTQRLLFKNAFSSIIADHIAKKRLKLLQRPVLRTDIRYAPRYDGRKEPVTCMDQQTPLVQK